MQRLTPSDPVSIADTPAVQPEKPAEHSSATEGAEQRDLFARTQRRKLPDERKSITHKFSVGGHEGYIIVGKYAEGAPGEIFIKMAKEGSTLSGFMDGLALSISPRFQFFVLRSTCHRRKTRQGLSTVSSVLETQIWKTKT